MMSEKNDKNESNAIEPVSETENFLSHITKLNSLSEVRTNCKLCNSKHKAKAHEMAAAGSSVNSILNYLKTNGEDISYGAVSNHINNHFRAIQDNTNLQEFATKMSMWGSSVVADESLLRRFITFLDMEAMTLAANNNNLDTSERRKNDEIILKIAATIALYKDKLREMNADLRPVQVVITSLNRIIQVKLEGTSNQEVKRVLQDIIEQLVREIGEMPLEGLTKKEN